MGGGADPHKKQQAKQRKIHGAPQSLHHESSAAVKANSFKTIQSKMCRTCTAVVGFAVWTITDDGTGWVIVTAHEFQTAKDGAVKVFTSGGVAFYFIVNSRICLTFR